MEYKRRLKKRTLNEYRQTKDTVYKNPHPSPKSNSHRKFFEQIQDLSRQMGDDQSFGGAVRRALRRHYEAEQQRSRGQATHR